MASKIKNIIFDLGGIFIKINYQKTEDAFVQLGIKNFNEFYKQDFVSSLFENIEVGAITPQQFYDGIRDIAKINLTNEQIESAWNAMLGDFWVDRLHWLNTIKNQYNIFLFSNTNEIHYKCFMKMYDGLQLPNTFSSYFIKDYYSHTLGLRKPTTESYNTILQEQNLVASETLFIDDTLKNIEGAKSVGLQTILLLGNINLVDEVDEFFK